MNLFNLSAKISLDDAEFNKGVDQATKKGKGFASSVKGFAGSAMTAFTKLSKVGVGALTAIGGLSTKVGMDFESAMSQVASTMGMTTEEIANGSEAFNMLEKAAKDAGKSTKFSASESAEALNYLALAGYDAEKAVNALPTVLNLASAGGLELAYASDLVTDSMSALGLETSQLEGFVDQLAKTSQKSNTNIGQLGEAILTVGGTAKTMKGGTVELSTQLGILADNGIKGAEGGTILRNVLLSLGSPVDKASGLMKELGLQVYDSSGKMRATNDIFKDLNNILGTMTEQKRTEVLSTLFNKVDLKGVNALLANSGQRFDELSDAIAKAEGSASNMAKTMNDNLKGKITILKSSLEGLGIAIYEKVEEPMKSAVDNITVGIGKLTDAFSNGSIQTIIDTIKGLITEGVTGAVNIIVENVPNLLNAVIYALNEAVNAIINGLPLIIESGIKILNSLVQGIFQALPNLISSIPEIINNFTSTIMGLFPLVIESGVDLLLNLIEGIINTIPSLVDSIPQIIDGFVNTVMANFPYIVETGINLLLRLIDGIINALPQLIGAVPQIISSIVNTIVSNLPRIIAMGVEIIAKLVVGLIQAIPKLVSAVPELIKAIVGAFKTGVGSFIDIGKNIVKGVWNGIVSAKDWLFGKVKGFFGGLKDKAKEVLDIHSPSRVFRDEVGKYMAQGVGVGFEDEMDNINADVEKALNTTVDVASDTNTPTSQENGLQTVITLLEEILRKDTTLTMDGKTLARGLAPYKSEINRLDSRDLVFA